MKRISILWLLLASLSIATTSLASIRYVKPIASGNGLGSSWTNAAGASNLQTMINNSVSGDEVWVAAGTYYPTSSPLNSTAPRDMSFSMKQGVSIYGGFVGTETILSQRNIANNSTILSGDIGIPNNNSDNCYHVIYNFDPFGIGTPSSTSLLDGFVITGGNANGTGSPYGGGIFNNTPNYNPNIVNCIFKKNAAQFGGGVTNIGSTYSSFSMLSPTYTNCLFYENQALGTTPYSWNGTSLGTSGGGAVLNVGFIQAVITNCTFANNTAQGNGGAFDCVKTSVTPNSFTLNNCILWGNTAASGNQIYLEGINFALSNTLLQGGISAISSNASTTINNNGNIVSTNPLFVNTSAGNYSLQTGSPAINTGSNALVPSGITNDISGATRIIGSSVDMGAYESGCQTLTNLSSTNNALHFDGINDCVNLHSCSGSNIFPGGDAITIEYWFKGTHLQSPVRFQPGTDWIVAGWTNNVVSNIPKHILSNDGGINGIKVANSTADIYDNNWHHIAMTWQKNQKFTSYLDGVQIEQRNASSTPLPSFNTTCYLGSYLGQYEFLNGSLDEVRVWTAARTQSQIQSGIYCTSANTAGLLLYYKFDQAIANGSNSPSDNNLANSASGNVSSGVLLNFALTGNTSNWVTGKPGINPFHKLYVDSSKAISGDGSSWLTAFKTMQEALIIAQGCSLVDTIWVAKGSYYPSADIIGNSPANPRDKTFKMVNNVAILGGFTGNETLLSQRNLANNQSVLSGDIGIANNTSDNCYHVITNVNGTNNTALLNGFVIKGGNANGTGTNQNRGGGILNIGDNGSCSPSFINCIIKQNIATSGGGVANGGDNGACNASFTNCLFYDNQALSGTTSNGGALYCLGNVLSTITNCTFGNNSASGLGGAICCLNTSSLPQLVVNNCILWGNTAPSGNQMFLNSTQITIANTILQGGTPGIGSTTFISLINNGNVISSDPMFVDAANGNFKLQSTSPAINAGLNSLVPSSITTDIIDAQRFQTAIVDMGAYETPCQAPASIANTANNALNFDGINDHIALTKCPNGNIFPGGDAITIEYWFKGSHLQSPVRFQRGGDYIVAGWTGNNVNALPLHILSNDGGTTNGIIAAPALSWIYDNNWHHIAMTWKKNQQFTAYFDGAFIQQRAAGANPLPSFDIECYLGSYLGIYEFLNGSLDEVRIWTTARTQAQINDGMFCNLQDTSGLLMRFRFDHAIANGSNSANNILANQTSNNNVYGILRNFALNSTTSNWVNGKPGASLTHKIYVDSSKAVSGNGSSWANAFKTLQEAMNFTISPCTPIDTIWVAKGTYYPTTTTNRNSSFQLRNNLAIYGGFAGTETSLSQRNLSMNPSILSGDIGIPNNNTDNSYHVITDTNGTNSTAVLNGFVITRGNANGTGLFADNSFGGGIFHLATNASCSPTFINCTIMGNYAVSGGGVAFIGINGTSNSSYTNCLFYQNHAEDGGAFYSYGILNSIFTNCTFAYNSAANDGGSLYVDYGNSNFSIANCIIWGNANYYGYEPQMELGSYNNLTISNSIVQSAWSLGYNNFTSNVYNLGNLIDIYPLFVDPANGNYNLATGSSAINSGSNTAIPSGITTDITGASRIQLGTVDMGAYEFHCTINSTTNQTICSNQLPYSYLGHTMNAAGSDTLHLAAVNGCDSLAILNLTVNTCNNILTVKLFIEGYYMGANLMTPTLMNEGIGNSTVNVDTILIQLRNASAPYAVAASTNSILKTDGTALASFSNVVPNGNYYIVIKHRNAVETWSANPINLPTISTYDFTTAANQAFGSNQTQAGAGVWAIYSGDINADENADLLDLSILEADINDFQFGYFATDLNGDGNVDLLDAPVLESNVNQFVFSNHP